MFDNNSDEKLTKVDVMGEYDVDNGIWLSQGMVVARSNEKCPQFNDIVPTKAVTIVCNKNLRKQAVYWLGYCLGHDCVDKTKDINNDEIAIRARYMCW